MSLAPKSLFLFMLSLALTIDAQASPDKSLKDLLIPVCVNQECGVINEQGAILEPFSRSNSFSPADFKSFYIFKQHEKCGLKNRAGAVLVKPQYNSMLYLGDGLVAFNKGEHWGIMNANGSTLIRPNYADYFFYFKKAEAISMNNGLHHFLFDKSGHPFGIESVTAYAFSVLNEDDGESEFDHWIKVKNPAPDEREIAGEYLFNTQTRKKTRVYDDIKREKNG